MTYAIEIKNLHKRYGNGFQALKGIDLNVAEGDFFALLGPNGAGKSTAIGIICSLVRKTSGTVRLFGTDMDANPTKIKSMLGVVPQEFNFNMYEPVQEIVVNQAGFFGIPRKKAFKLAEKVLDQLGLWDKRRDQARELSGGMKRRLMIARALIHSPRLLILDEPTAGVDIEIRHSTWEFMRQINEAGTTIILTTHYLEEAESLCRNIAIIDQGEIIEHSPMSQLLQRVNKETFIIYTKSLLNRDINLQDCSYRLVDDHTLELEIERDYNMNLVFAQLQQHGIEVSSLKNKSNRLEQLFLDLLAEKSIGQNRGLGR